MHWQCMSDCVVDLSFFRNNISSEFCSFLLKGYLKNKEWLWKLHWRRLVSTQLPMPVLDSLPPCAYPMCAGVLTHHILCISLGAINSSLFSPQIILYHIVIKGETCNLGLSFKNADLAPAELQPLILSLLFWPEEFTKPFSEQYLQSLCVSPVRHVFMLTSTPCGNLRPNVNISEAKLRKLKSFLCLCMRLLWITNDFL